MPVEYNLNVPSNGLRFAIDSKNLRSFPGQNFLLQSENFAASANWGITNGAVATANVAVGPFGYGGADLVVTSTTSPSLISQTISTTATGTGQLVMSVYAKAATSTQFTMNGYYVNDTEYNATYTLSGAGAIGGTGSPQIESVGNGWYRCYLTIPARVGTGTSVGWRIWPEPRANATGIGCYFWGAQLRTSQANNAYVGTTTAAVGSSGIAYDLSGYGNDVTMGAGATASLLNGCSFYVDGTTTGNLFKDTTNSLPTGDATVLVWHRPALDAAANAYTGLLRWGVGGNVDPSTSIILGLNTTTSTFYVTSTYSSNDYTPNNASLTATAGQWNLIGIQVDAGMGPLTTNNTTLLKYNNSGYFSLTGRSSASRRVSATNSSLRVGCTDTNGARMTKGEIGSAYVYNRVLTSAEIADFIRVTKGKYGVA